jgi:glutathione S-transferase
MGEEFSIADAYLFTVLNWTDRLNVDLSRWANIQTFKARVAERAAVKKAMKAEGLTK